MQPFQRLICPLGGRGAALHLLAGVQRGAFYKAHTLSALRRFYIYPTAGGLAQKLLKRFPAVHLAWEQHGLRPSAAVRGIVLQHEAGHGLAVVLKRLVHHFDVFPGKVAVYKVQHGKAALRAAAEAYRVRVGKGRGYDALLVGKAFDRAQSVAQRRGLFKAKLLSRALHFLLKLGCQLRALPFEDEHGLRHSAPVLLPVGRAAAPTGAVAHVVVQAGALLANITRELLRAGRQKQRFLYSLYYLMRLAAAAEGAEIARAVLGLPVDKAHPRILALHVHAHKGIALIVLEEDVILRLVPLYKRVFQHQRFKLASGDNDVEIAHLFHHRGDLRQVLAVEIAADAVFQLLRLADVYDLVMLVEHDVHAWQKRKIIRFFAESIKHLCALALYRLLLFIAEYRPHGY